LGAVDDGAGKFERGERRAGKKILVEKFFVGAEGEQVARVGKKSGRIAASTESAGVRDRPEQKSCGDLRVEEFRSIVAEVFENSFAGRGRAWVFEFEEIAGVGGLVAGVVVENQRRRRREKIVEFGPSVAEARGRRKIDSDDEIAVVGLEFVLELVAVGDEVEGAVQGSRVKIFDGFPHFFEDFAEAELGADAVAVGVVVAENEDFLGFLEEGAGLGSSGMRHFSSGGI